MSRRIRFLLLSDALLILGTDMLAPLYAVFVQGIGGDLLTAGWAYASFSITTGVVMLIISSLVRDIRGREMMVPTGYAMSAVGVLGYLVVESPWQLFLVEVWMGFALAILTPAWDALFSEFLDEGKAVLEWGVEESLDYIVPGVAAAIGSLIATYFGFPTLFLVMFAFSVAATLVSLRAARRI